MTTGPSARLAALLALAPALVESEVQPVLDALESRVRECPSCRRLFLGKGRAATWCSPRCGSRERRRRARAKARHGGPPQSPVTVTPRDGNRA